MEIEAEELEARNARAREIAAGDDIERVVEQVGTGQVFLPYQVKVIEAAHAHELLVVEKSRRIGVTWAFAGDDAIFAATRPEDGGSDVLYISYSFDMAREYIDAAAGFARAFMGVDAQVGEYMFVDEDPNAPGETREIKAFRIDFASGHAIQALTSKPRSLRGKQGRVRIDEAAFVDNLEQLLDAAMALVMWGGSVAVMSTHFGVDNAFNQLIQKIRAGERAGEVVRVTFQDALEQGFYERVCLRKRETPTPEGKAAYIKKIYGLYGAAAAQELDVIPSRSEGAWLPFDLVERAERKELPVKRLSFPNDFTFKPDHVRNAAVLDWCDRELTPILDAIRERGNAIGVGDDFARNGDLSDIWLLEELQDRSWTTPLLVEMRNVPFEEQLFVRVFMLRKLVRWRAKVDANGNGASSAERLGQIFGQSRVEAIKAREDWWRDQGPPLKARFEDGRIEIPQDTDVSADIRGVQVVNGAPRIPVKRTTAKGEEAAAQAGKPKRHGDAAVALFHASAALREGAIGEVELSSAEPTGAPASFWGDSASDGHSYETLNLSGYA